MAINSREKGKKGERELASKLREYGYQVRRGQQYSGTSGDADVVGLPGIHVECKRTERTAMYDWIAQAKADAAKNGRLPAVFHRKNDSKWLVIMELDDWIKLYEESGRNNDVGPSV